MVFITAIDTLTETHPYTRNKTIQFKEKGREKGRKEGKKEGGKEGRREGGKEGRKEGVTCWQLVRGSAGKGIYSQA